jgi:hypothetical protein
MSYCQNHGIRTPHCLSAEGYQMSRVRHNTGSVLFDKGRGTWRLPQWVGGKRRSQTLGTKQELANKAAAWKVARALMPKKPNHATGFTVSSLVDIYRAERMPQRFSTRYSYDQWLTNHILPRWGEGSITDVKPRPVELWLHSLTLSPKSRVHIRGVLHQLWEFAMWRGDGRAQPDDTGHCARCNQKDECSAQSYVRGVPEVRF